MLTKEKIEENKKEFLELVDSIKRDGIDKETLFRQLTESDFFYAPASADHHGSFRGGLCEHCLRVYYNLIKLYKEFINEEITDAEMDTIKIVSLFHDFSKMNYYIHEVKNKKVYSENGSKQDTQGRYDWVQVVGYARRDSKDRFAIGNHEENSVYMTSVFIPLTQEEYCAILNHHGGNGYDSTKLSPCELWQKYPLSLLLYQADCIAAFVQESNE